MMYERKIAKHMELQRDALHKMNNTNNLIMKAKYFRDAAAENEQLSYYHTDRYNFVPIEDEDVVTVGDGLLVSKEGSIWTTIKEDTFLGKKYTNVFIGRAFLKELKPQAEA